MTKLDTLELNKNKLASFFDNALDMRSLYLVGVTYLSLNGNQLT